MKNLKSKLMATIAIATLSISAFAFADAPKAKDPANCPKPPQVTCPSCGHKFDMPRPAHRGQHRGARMMKFMQKECAFLAELTGKDAKDICKELHEKKLMPAQYAKQNGVYDAYKAKKMERVKARLDQRVKDGKLTQAKADEKLEKISKMFDNMSNGIRPQRPHRHGKRPGAGNPHRINGPKN